MEGVMAKLTSQVTSLSDQVSDKALLEERLKKELKLEVEGKQAIVRCSTEVQSDMLIFYLLDWRD